MGMEAEGELSTQGQTVHVKALLESHELIFRGAVKKTLPLHDITDPRAVDDQLLFEHAGHPYALSLPAGQADKWLKKMTSQPPSLAQKLGVDAGHKALVWGDISDAKLVEALSGATTPSPQQAAIALAVTREPDELSDALGHLATALPQAPIWIVYPKGAKSTLPESAVRSHMHSLGFVDSKSCAVSDRLSATRFGRRKAG